MRQRYLSNIFFNLICFLGLMSYSEKALATEELVSIFINMNVGDAKTFSEVNKTFRNVACNQPSPFSINRDQKLSPIITQLCRVDENTQLRPLLVKNAHILADADHINDPRGRGPQAKLRACYVLLVHYSDRRDVNKAKEYAIKFISNYNALTVKTSAETIMKTSLGIFKVLHKWNDIVIPKD